MRRIRQTLRLHLQAGLSFSDIGRALKLSKSVVGKYVSLARAAGVDWALAQTLSDSELEARLYRPAMPRCSSQPAPDYARIHQELKRAGSLRLVTEVQPTSLDVMLSVPQPAKPTFGERQCRWIRDAVRVSACSSLELAQLTLRGRRRKLPWSLAGT